MNLHVSIDFKLRVGSKYDRREFIIEKQFLFTSKPLLAECTSTYHDLFRLYYIKKIINIRQNFAKC